MVQNCKELYTVRRSMRLHGSDCLGTGIRKISLQPAGACSTDTAVILQSPGRASVMVLFFRQKSHHWRSFPGCNDNKLLFGNALNDFFRGSYWNSSCHFVERFGWTAGTKQSLPKSFHSLTRNETSQSYSEYHSRGVWCKRYVARLWLVRTAQSGLWLAVETHFRPSLRFPARKCI